MNNNLALFTDLGIQTQKTWHIGLSEELQTSLKQRAVTLKGILIQATLRIGEEFAVAQKELAYKNGGFVKWCEEEVGIDNERAYEAIRVWENYKMFALSANILDIGKKVLIASSRSDVPQEAREEIVRRHNEGEKITLALSDEIIKKHQAEVAAIRERAEEAEALASKKDDELRLTRHYLFDLKREMESLPTPEPEIREVEKPGTIARLEQLETEKESLERQRDKWKELADGLSADLASIEEVAEAKRERELRDLRVRQNWQQDTKAMYNAVLKFLGQLPMTVDAQLFESDDWMRLDEVVQAFRSGIAACDRLRASPALMIVESRT